MKKKGYMQFEIKKNKTSRDRIKPNRKKLSSGVYQMNESKDGRIHFPT